MMHTHSYNQRDVYTIQTISNLQLDDTGCCTHIHTHNHTKLLDQIQIRSNVHNELHHTSFDTQHVHNIPRHDVSSVLRRYVTLPHEMRMRNNTGKIYHWLCSLPKVDECGESACAHPVASNWSDTTAPR